LKDSSQHEAENILKARVQAALGELLPAMVVDGGGAEVVSVDSGTVTVRLTGSCLFCPSRELSADALVRGIRKRVEEIYEIKIIYPPF